MCDVGPVSVFHNHFVSSIAVVQDKISLKNELEGPIR